MGSLFSSPAAVERDVLTYSVLFEFGLNENPLSKLLTDKELATAYGYGIVQASSTDGDFGDTEKDWCRGILLRRGTSLSLTSMVKENISVYKNGSCNLFYIYKLCHRY